MPPKTASPPKPRTVLLKPTYEHTSTHLNITFLLPTRLNSTAFTPLLIRPRTSTASNLFVVELCEKSTGNVLAKGNFKLLVEEGFREFGKGAEVELLNWEEGGRRGVKVVCTRNSVNYARVGRSSRVAGSDVGVEERDLEVGGNKQTLKTYRGSNAGAWWKGDEMKPGSNSDAGGLQTTAEDDGHELDSHEEKPNNQGKMKRIKEKLKGVRLPKKKRSGGVCRQQ